VPEIRRAGQEGTVATELQSSPNWVIDSANGTVKNRDRLHGGWVGSNDIFTCVVSQDQTNQYRLVVK